MSKNNNKTDQFRPLLDEFIRIGFNPARFTEESAEKFAIHFVNLDNFGKFVEMVFDGSEMDNTSLTGRAFNPASGVKDIWIYNVDVKSNLEDVKKSGSALYLGIIASVTIPFSDYDEILLRLRGQNSVDLSGQISKHSFTELRSCASPCGHSKKNLQFGDCQGDIDLGIHDLIKSLWQAGVQTFGECESDPESGRTVLHVFGADSVHRLGQILVQNGNRSIVNTIAERALCPELNMANGWRRNKVLLNLDKLPGSEGKIIFGESIYIPKSDIPELMQLVKEFNAKS